MAHLLSSQSGNPYAGVAFQTRSIIAPRHETRYLTRYGILWFLLLFLSWNHSVAAVDILDLPTALDHEYDLTWAQPCPLRQPVRLRGEGTVRQPGYRLSLTNTQLIWTTGQNPITHVSLPSPITETRTMTLKRRHGVLGVFVDHRFLAALPYPQAVSGSLQFIALPSGHALATRYVPYTPRIFGDDFMRKAALETALLAGERWQDDLVWHVAFFHTPDPGAHPVHPTTGAPVLNPWQLTLFPAASTTANAFWYLYTGIGPSWVVPHPTLMGALWDAYAVEVAVKPEFGGEVGLLAAYQDPQNYLLFRVRYAQADTPPIAELLAVTAGQFRILAQTPVTLPAGQWATLRLQLGWTSVQALIDGIVVMRTVNPGPAEGRIGLYASGVTAPKRPPIDAATAAMYGEDVTPHADGTSCIAFDDVTVESWRAIDDLLRERAMAQHTGTWRCTAIGWQAQAPASVLTTDRTCATSTLHLRLRMPSTSAVEIVLQSPDDQTSYRWRLSPHGQSFVPIVQGHPQAPVLTCAAGIPAQTWVTCDSRMDGPHMICTVDGLPVFDWWDPQRTTGRCGLLVTAGTVEVTDINLRPHSDDLPAAVLNPEFARRAYENTWASPEADWYPDAPLDTLYLPADLARITTGSAPITTDVPGLYWHKAGIYGDLTAIIPFTKETLADQELLLAPHGTPAEGYRLTITKADGHGVLTLTRRDTVVGTAPFPLTAVWRLRCVRQGPLLRVDQAVIDDDARGPWQVCLSYRDPAPLPAETLGFRVTHRGLPAAAVTLTCRRYQETFERAPVLWRTEGGLWSVMARWTCKPKFNWFGGYGSGTPTAWSKLRLDGDQTVEVYAGIRMQYDNVAEEYARRFRDLNVSWCTDGVHRDSGYTLMRATRTYGESQTVLLRKGVVVATTTDPKALLPQFGQGHNRWFHTRVEQRGGTITVFLDNHRALSYADPEPLPGGYVACWTINNGMLLGRINLSATQMRVQPIPPPMPISEQRT